MRWGKVVLFGQKWLCSVKGGCTRAKKGCIRAPLFYLGKVVVIRQKLLFSGNLVVVGQFGCIRTESFFRAKVVVLEQNGSNRPKIVVFGQKWLYLGKVIVSLKVIVFWQKWLYSGKWLYLVKVVVFGLERLYSG